MLVSSNLFKKSSKSRKVRCEICANYCKIADGSYGICKQHKNINGELFDESFGVVSSLNADSIEKKKAAISFFTWNFNILCRWFWV